jgi:biopolymer transport protein ExbD
MIDFSQQRRSRPRGENIVPMINVVFLLLIFFLMSARIAPPDPVTLSLPQSSSDTDTVRADTLYIDKDGTFFFGGRVGEDVFAALAQADIDTLLIRADAALPASVLTSLLTQVADLGIRDSRLVTGGR